MKSFLHLMVITLLGACVSEPMDSSDLPELSVEDLNVLEGDITKSIYVNLRLTKAAQDTVYAFLQTQDGSAKAGQDYIGFNSKSISFNPGVVQSDCRIEILGDAIFEPDEMFEVQILEAQGVTISDDVAIVFIENDDQDKNVNIPDSGYETPESYAGMEMIWSEEFSEGPLNLSNWTFEIGNGASGWGNNELQYYRKDNTFFQEGHLVIQARDENFSGFQYTSSRIITKDKFEFKYGRVDIRAALPKGQGIWPALWMLGHDISEVGWPECGEIDIMELVGHEPSTVHGTAHYPDPNGNRLLNGDEISLNDGSTFSDEFHVFSIIWEENKVEWYLDDQLYHTITPTSLGIQNPWPFNKEFFFIFNIAVGGNWPGNPDNSTQFPQNMIVDYIRVFQEE